jgi:CopA family copper-resistance protein
MLLQRAGVMGLLAAVERLAPAYARANTADTAAQSPSPVGGSIDLEIGDVPLPINGRVGKALGINGSVPGPLIRLREGEEAVLRVTNRLKEIASIHWHGLLLPPGMDGVPGVSFAGIAPGETFTYRFPVVQYGTYWCHSHSGGQELLGVYAPIIIDPAGPEPFQYDRDYVVLLSDWSFESPMTIISHLKKQANYYNRQMRTWGEFSRDVAKNGWSATVKERQRWAKMLMDPTDLADVTGSTYSFLMNGLPPAANWTALFRPGERVRLRFIDAGAMTYFDIRIPGLKMTLVQADGQNVKPVTVDEFRIGPGETYDVIVEPVGEQAYTIFAESMDRSGYTRGTLAPKQGMTAPIPKRRPRPTRTMADMGMEMPGMDMGAKKEMPGMEMPDMEMPAEAAPKDAKKKMPGMEMPGGKTAPKRAKESMPGMKMPGDPKAAERQGMTMSGPNLSNIPGSVPVKHGPDRHGAGNSIVPMSTRSRLHEPGTGLEDTGTRVLVYTDLQSLMPGPDPREPMREIEMHITGNMERYMWSFDGKKYSEAKTPLAFHYGERLRLTLVNDTMMEHPIHLHGMWMELENGAGRHKPRKHTISVKPAERLSVAITADAPGQWAMHCHLLLHMEMGMFRVVEVSPPKLGAKP